VSVIKLKIVPRNNLVPSIMTSCSGQSLFKLDDLSSNDEEYLMCDNVAEMTPG